jgi:biuret amidohydrolase
MVAEQETPMHTSAHSFARPILCRYQPMKHVHGLDIPQTLEDVCDPRRMALVVYDMQVGILKQIKNPDTIVAKVSRVLEAARAAGVRIFFMRHMSLPKELMGAFAYRMAMAWQRTDDPEKVTPWFLRGSPGVEIIPELAPRPSEAIFDKLTMSALEGTPLAIALRDCGITSVALVGVAMEIGIEPTARHAADLGIVPVIIEDACGCGDAGAAQRSIEALKFAGDAVFADVDAVCAALKRRGG